MIVDISLSTEDYHEASRGFVFEQLREDALTKPGSVRLIQISICTDQQPSRDGLWCGSIKHTLDRVGDSDVRLSVRA